MGFAYDLLKMGLPNGYVRLDEYRKSKGACTMREILIDIGERMKAAGGLKKCGPREIPVPVVIPTFDNLKAEVEEFKMRLLSGPESEEQLSLF